MNENDISEIMKKLTTMINSDSSDNSNNYENSYNNNNSETINFENSKNSDSNVNNFNIDIETLLKIKNIIDKMNIQENDARVNLLLSLKPYLKPSRKDKINQYIQLLNMGNIIELLKSEDNNNYDINDRGDKT